MLFHLSKMARQEARFLLDLHNNIFIWLSSNQLLCVLCIHLSHPLCSKLCSRVFKYSVFALGFEWILWYMVHCTVHHIDFVSTYFQSQAKCWLQYLSSVSQKLEAPFYFWVWMDEFYLWHSLSYVFGHPQMKCFSSVLKMMKPTFVLGTHHHSVG